MWSDPIADLLCRIRNATRALHADVGIPYSRLKESIARLLKREGYVADVAVEGGRKKTLRLKLRYEGKRSVIEGLRRLSTPGRRVYVGASDLPRVRGGLGVVILSTPAGVLTDREARQKNVGGEVLCSVW